MTRESLLKQLIEFKKPSFELEKELQQFGWDSEVEMILLKRSNLLNALNRCISNEINIKDLEDWAGSIECREDIGREVGYEELINDIVHRLANSPLEGAITKEKLEDMRNLLRKGVKQA